MRTQQSRTLFAVYDTGVFVQAYSTLREAQDACLLRDISAVFEVPPANLTNYNPKFEIKQVTAYFILNRVADGEGV